MNRRSFLPLALALLACLLVVKAVQVWVERDTSAGSGAAASGVGDMVDRASPAEPSVQASPVSGADLQREARAGAREAIGPESGEHVMTSLGPLVTGRVVDSEDQAIANARVLLTNEYNPQIPLEAVDEFGRSPFPMVEAVTDQDGRFSVLEGLESRRGLSLIVRSDGYPTYRFNGAWMYPERTVDVGTLRMPPGARLTGRVVDAKGAGVQARLVRGVEVDDRNMAWGDRPIAFGQGIVVLGASDAEGRFELTGLSPGKWTVLAQADGFLTGTASVTSIKGKTQTTKITLDRGARIRGALVGKPAEETELSAFARPAGESPGRAEPRVAPLGADGDFEFDGLVENQTYEIGVFRPGSSPRELAEVAVVEAAAQRQGAPSLRLEWRVLSEFVLQLTDATTGEPVEEACVYLKIKGHGTRQITESHFPEGRCHFNGQWLPTLKGAELRVQSTGYVDQTVGLEGMRRASSLNPLTIRLAPGPTVVVQVSDSGGTPVEGAEVLLGAGRKDELDQRSETAHLQPRTWRTRRSTTGSDGHAVLSALRLANERPTDGKLAVFADGYAPAWVDVDAEQRAVDVTLHEGAHLVVRAVDAAGRSLDGVIVELQRFDGSAWPMKAGSTEDGVVTFEHLAPTTHRYRARIQSNAWRPPGYDPEAAWVSVDLREGETTESELECQGFYDLEGLITDRGEPLGGAQMVLLPGDRTVGEYQWFDFHSGRGTRFHVQSRVDGSFQFHVIPEGSYTLLVEHGFLSVAARIPVEVARNSGPLTLRLTSTIVKGTVTFTDNKPAANAYVFIGEIDGPSNGKAYTDESGHFVITGAPSGRPLEIRAGGRFIKHRPERLQPLLAAETRHVDLVGDERGAARFTWIGEEPKSFRVQGTSADGRLEAVMARPGDSEKVVETSGCVPGPWVFQLEVVQADGKEVKTERRVEITASEVLEVTMTPE